MFPVPLLRAHLVLPDVPAALPSSVPVPLGERLFRSSPVYHRMTASVSEDSVGAPVQSEGTPSPNADLQQPLSSVTPDLACSSLIAHPALPVCKPVSILDALSGQMLMQVRFPRRVELAIVIVHVALRQAPPDRREQSTRRLRGHGDLAALRPPLVGIANRRHRVQRRRRGLLVRRRHDGPVSSMGSP